MSSKPNDQLDAVLGAVIGKLADGRERPGQLAMAHAVDAALKGRRHLLVQAGTGTGKGIAYLVPSLLLGKPVIISTSTKALQSQLIEGDLPPILDAVEEATGSRPEVAVIKGRANYLCRLKLADVASAGEQQTFGDDFMPGMLDDPDLQAADQRSRSASAVGKTGAAVVALRKWAETTETGDQADLPDTIDFDARAWSAVSVSARECIGRDRCDFGDECFAELARDSAEGAGLVITNHHLLALDLQTSGSLLPDRRAIVIDEAHDVVDRVTGACAHELSTAVLQRLAARLPDVVDHDSTDDLADAAADFIAVVDTLRAGPLRPVPPELVIVARALDTALTAALKPLASSQNSLIGSKAATAQMLKAAGDAAVLALDRIVENSEDDVTWLETPERGRPTLRVAPLSVSAMLAEKLFNSTTTIMTSATLRAGGGFPAVAARMGLNPAVVAAGANAAASPAADRWDSLDVGSPFDYDQQGVLYVATDLPDPSSNREQHTDEMRERLVELVKAAGGRCLGLFTSHAAASAAAMEVRTKALKRVLLQGDAPLNRLIQQFRDEPDTCLFGSLSLWQGVDVPGPSCQLVVIDKLPFPRPDDPLPAARKTYADNHGRNGFVDVYASHAATLLAQGVGRLVRSGSDRGVVAILDPRLHTKAYGRIMLNELPPMRRLKDLDPVLAALRRLNELASD